MPASAPARSACRRAAAARWTAHALVAALALGALAFGGAGAIRGAEGLSLVTRATYVPAPDDGAVHVAIDAVATPVTPDSATQRTYYTGVTLAVQPGAVGAAATAENGSPLPLTVTEADEYVTTLDITFDRDVFFDEPYAFSVRFDLPDPGGQPDRDVRVGTSLLAFPVWAFGTDGTPGSEVEVRVPTGYFPTVEFGELEAASGAHATVLRSGPIDDALDWFAYVTAEAPGAFDERALDLRIGTDAASVLIRGWEDDAAWSERMAGWVRDGIPALARSIGLPWPMRGELEIEEAATSRLGGYAGVYDEVRERIHIRYDADAFIALHEVAHAWFNDRLIEGRWISEAFASLYAEEAGDIAGFDAEPYRLDGQLQAYRIPLNAWGEVGTEDPGTEDFAYAATYEVARHIADRATVDGLQAVWQSLAEQRGAYQPVAAGAKPERSEAVTQEGWQRLLDHLEQATGQQFDDIWREWVVTAAQEPLLDERAEARAQYAATLTAAEGWELPRQVRHVMGAWDFEDASALLLTAQEVLDQRDGVEDEAAALDLEPPDRLRRLFETGGTLDAAAAEAEAEIAGIERIGLATDRLAVVPSALETLGLLGRDPEAELLAARDAWEKGDVDLVEDATGRAIALRDTAEAAGRDRALVGGAAILALDGLALVAVGARRQRRHTAA